ncbi:MAG: PorT family protein [Chitinophagaceae bacterium]|nr:MAG: PorT family protein [Chitinophagaceae bacterium]
MKRIFTLCVAVCTFMTSFAQTDSTGKPSPDTIRIGGMVIIREGGNNNNNEDSTRKRDRIFRINRRNNEKPANVSTNWWILDLGFANWSDKTNYSSLEAQSFAPGANEDNLKLRSGKSRSVNIWIFMQRLNLIKHTVNLKYGLGVELNNYHFENKETMFTKNPTIVDIDGYAALNPSKNKLAADYLTVPVMLNFNFTPNNKRAYGFSAGVSAGYLYSSRQKTKADGDVDKVKSDFNLRKWKLSYVGEVSLGIVKLYGSYAIKGLFEDGLDMTPYTVGFRFSNW